MRHVNSAKWGIIVMLVLIAVYLVAIGQMAWGMLTSGQWIGIVMGGVLVLFPVLGVVFVAKDLQFVARSNRLIARMADAGELPEDTLPRQASGRINRDAADADFERWKRQVEDAPERWQNWVLLGLAYRASGDSPRARAALRRAILLERGAAA